MFTLEESSRTRRVIGDDGVQKLADASILVFGVGGVGGAVCEALALMIADKTDLAMNRYNTGKQKKPAAPKSDTAGEQNEEGGSCT